jgi:ferric-dicitrate binding protein FerR (iron transport regulator)
VAAIAGVLAIAYLSWPGAATRETGGGSPASRIVPGKARAELQLASGETIPLEGHGKDERWRAGGIVLENDTVAGRLKYGVTEKSARDETRYHTLYVPRGGEYQLELPDGTRVWINSKSSVRFPERFGDPAREVYLRGEAYFAVAKREGMPFRVHAGQQVITVTGTSFNASAYEDDEVWRTTLVEGSIRVEENGKTVEVRPSEQYVVERRQGRHRVEAVNSEWYTSWIDGRFYFKAFTFEELVRKLERWYDFRMIYEDEAIKGRRFTGFVNKHEPIERALALLEMTTSIQFHVVDKTITVKRK